MLRALVKGCHRRRCRFTAQIVASLAAGWWSAPAGPERPRRRCGALFGAQPQPRFLPVLGKPFRPRPLVPLLRSPLQFEMLATGGNRLCPVWMCVLRS